MVRLTRRGLLQATAALAAPSIVRAQGATLRLGVLTPLTGAGSFDGPRMLKAMQAVANDINAGGGLLGRKIELVVEDDETNPEAAVRAAHKLVNVDKVPVIMGTWASAVTTAVAPVCWESKTFLTTVSGADSITHLPHQGYLIRTQPNNQLQATKPRSDSSSCPCRRSATPQPTRPSASAQLVLNGIMAGAILAAPAIGFTAIYAVLRFPNFAVASHATIGAFAGYCANVWLGLPLLPSAVIAFVVAGMVGVASDTLVLRPLRPAGLITTTIASVALTIALENLVRLGFGNALRNYDLPIVRDWRFIGIRVGPQQLEDLAISAAAVTALFTFLAFTRLGKAMRAVADNPTLAAIKGIDADQIARVVNFIAMGLAGLGGMLLGLDTSIDPLTGFRAILAIFAAAVVGGLGSIPGAVVGALTVGVAEELSQLALPPDYRTVVGFIAILLVLSFRPRGILGARAY